VCSTAFSPQWSTRAGVLVGDVLLLESEALRDEGRRALGVLINKAVLVLLSTLI